MCWFCKAIFTVYKSNVLVLFRSINRCCKEDFLLWLYYNTLKYLVFRTFEYCHQRVCRRIRQETIVIIIFNLEGYILSSRKSYGQKVQHIMYIFFSQSSDYRHLYRDHVSLEIRSPCHNFMSMFFFLIFFFSENISKVIGIVVGCGVVYSHLKLSANSLHYVSDKCILI